MGRNYFQHDFNSRHNSKLILIRNSNGLEAIGFYWQIVEILHESTNVINCSTKLNKTLLASQFAITCEKLDELIMVLTEVELLTVIDGMISSDRVARNLEKMQDISQKRSNANKCRQLSTSVNKTQQNRQNKIKENKIKIKENNNTIPPLPPEWGEPTKAAFGEWLIFRKEKKRPVTYSQIAKLIQRCSLNEQQFVIDVNYSISQGYQGLFAPSEKNGTSVAFNGHMAPRLSQQAINRNNTLKAAKNILSAEDTTNDTQAIDVDPN